MQIVIDIPNKTYNALTHTEFDANLVVDEMRESIVHGTPLPKDHGNLVDYEELKNNASEYSAYAEVILSHIKPKIIIEADTESEG